MKSKAGMYFTSDLHLDHANIIKYCGRTMFMSDYELEMFRKNEDFKVSRESVQRMNRYLVDKINEVVGENDTLWVLGDVSFRGYNDVKVWRDQIACQNLYLIWGNHDDPSIAPLFKENHRQEMINVNGWNIFMNHYPLRSWERSHKGSIDLYGHVHGNADYADCRYLPNSQMLLCVDVGVDPPECSPHRELEHQMRPWAFEEILGTIEPKIPIVQANAAKSKQRKWLGKGTQDETCTS